MLNYLEFINEAVNYLHYIEAPAIKGVNKNKVLNLVNDSETSQLFTNNPSIDDIKFLNKYLLKNKYSLIRLYHGTDADIDIMNDGLQVTSAKTKRSMQSATSYVYLSIYDSSAKTFGEMAYPMKNINVYEVAIPIYFLKPDLDQLKNKRLWSGIECGDTLADSALFGSGFRVKGNIPPYMIKLVD